jgi:glycosyltransferase involved in cell wall biosynthesis
MTAPGTRVPGDAQGVHERPLRIGLVAPPFERVPPTGYGGTERVVHALAVELDRRGHRVTVFATGDSKVPGRLVPVTDAPVRDTGAAGIGAIPWLTVTQIAVLRAAKDLDIVHNHVDWAGLLLGDALGQPVVATFHGRLDIPGARELLLASRCHHVAISESQAASQPDACWSGVVHNGLDLSGAPFRPAADRTDDLCFVGRLVPEKGIVEAIEVARLSGRRLRIAAKAGAQPAEVDYFERVVRPAMRTADVEHLGELSSEDRDSLFAECHATLMPGNWPEPFGLVAIESLACGTPVLARSEGALPEIVREGLDGWLSDDVPQLASRVDDVGRLDRAAIRASVLERFSATRMADGYLEVYRRVLSDASHRDGGRHGHE